MSFGLFSFPFSLFYRIILFYCTLRLLYWGPSPRTRDPSVARVFVVQRNPDRVRHHHVVTQDALVSSTWIRDFTRLTNQRCLHCKEANVVQSIQLPVIIPSFNSAIYTEKLRGRRVKSLKSIQCDSIAGLKQPRASPETCLLVCHLTVQKYNRIAFKK